MKDEPNLPHEFGIFEHDQYVQCISSSRRRIQICKQKDFYSKKPRLAKAHLDETNKNCLNSSNIISGTPNTILQFQTQISN